MKANALEIQTPEGVTFSLALAGPVSRCLAWMLDLCVVLMLGTLLTMGLALVGWLSPDLARAVLVLGWFLLQVGYGAAFEWFWNGQTPGKRCLGLRVIDAEGFRLTFNQVLMRNLLRFVDSLPGAYLVGGAAVMATRGSQRLGDLAANTVVVRQALAFVPDWEGIEPGKYNSLLSDPALVARLRQRTDPQAAYLALRSLMRRRDLDPDARLEVFRVAAGHYRALVRFPDDLVEGLSDEQLVRNVVEAVFRSAPREIPGEPRETSRATIFR